MAMTVAEPTLLALNFSTWLDANRGRLATLWADLGAAGPVFHELDAPGLDQSRQSYLLPLERVFAGALRGSAEHQAIYLEERVRYLEHLSPDDRARHVADGLVAEAAEMATLLPESRARDLERLILDLHEPITDPPSPVAKILFIGDCLFVETRAFLRPVAERAGWPVDVRQVFFSARQPRESVNTAIVTEVERFNPDLIGLSLFTFEGVPPYAAAWRQASRLFGARGALDMVDGLMDLLRETIADIRTVSDSTIAVHIPCGLPLDRYRRRIRRVPPHSRTQRRLLQMLDESVRELVSGTINTVVIDEPAVVALRGGVGDQGGPAFPAADVPQGVFHTTKLGASLAEKYNELLQDHLLLGQAKALLVDFDNTLWRGVMGDGEVVHHVEGQALLQELRNAGVLLVALSKNDPRTIRWDEMLLSRSDFALEMVNWRPKPDNVSAAIHQLDIAASAFILLDDNPVERALVTEQVPGVRAIDPTTPDAWRSLRHWLDLPSTRQTDEARRRTAMYRDSVERREAMKPGHDYGEMMASLALRYEFRMAQTSDLDRLLELIQRTNQFNTTTQRRSLAEIEAALQPASSSRVYVASLRDRFGDLGVVAVVMFDIHKRTFDSVIMSCRAMGFGLETAVVHEVIQRHGPGSFTGLFKPTERNSPAADLFERCGFTERSAGVFVLGSEDPGPGTPAWFR